MDSAKLQGVFGNSETSPKRKRQFWLETTSLLHIYSIGYILDKADGGLDVNIDRKMIKQGQVLPFARLKAGDKLYIYFQILKGEQIRSFKVGDESTIFAPGFTRALLSSYPSPSKIRASRSR